MGDPMEAATVDIFEHYNALSAVRKDNIVPKYPDMFLAAAREAGLIRFQACPSGHWQITPEGYAVLSECDRRCLGEAQ